MIAQKILSVAAAIMTFLSGTIYSPEAPEIPETPDIPETGDITGFAVPESLDFDGESFDIFISYGIYGSDYIPADEEGDIISDSVLKRNEAVEEHLGVDLNFVSHYAGGATSEPVIRTLIQAGDDTYEAITGNISKINTLIYEGMFTDLYELPYLDLHAPWWNTEINESINFAGKCYAAVGAQDLYNVKNTSCLMFNKDMMRELNIEYPYRLVREGTWTIDEFIGMVRSAAKDINGDGAMLPDNDRYGCSGWRYDMMPALRMGMGGDDVISDDNGMPKLNIDNDTSYTVTDKMISVFKSGGWDGGDTYGASEKMFEDSRLLFMNTTLGQLADHRKSPVDHGVLPYPKLDEAQRYYRSRIGNASATLVPITNTSPELTGAVLECMSYYSNETVLPAYLDIELAIRTARDIDSEEMIYLIKESGVVAEEDFITAEALVTMTEKGRNELSEICLKHGAEWEKRIGKMTDFLK